MVSSQRSRKYDLKSSLISATTHADHPKKGEEMPTPHKKAASKESYQVERVVDERYNPQKKEKEYLLKWKNFDANENTWEPETNLNCDDLIKEFHERKKQAPASGKRKRTSSEGQRLPQIPKRPRRSSASQAHTPKKSQISATPKRTGKTPAKKTSVSSSPVKESRTRRLSAADYDEIPAPAEGETSLEKGVKPVEIIGSCRGAGISPFDYIVKYVNHKSERVPATVCNKMFPQLVIDFFAKSAGHS